MGIEDLLLLQVLMLPLIWIAPTIARRFGIEARRIERAILLIPVTLLGVVVLLAVNGHRGTPTHAHAALWGVSDSIPSAIQYFAGGPEGGMLICAFVSSVWIQISQQRRGKGPWVLMTIYLFPLIAVGTSSEAFIPVLSSTLVSPFIPNPSFIPLILNSVQGFLIAELLIRVSASMDCRKVRKSDAYLGFTLALMITLLSLRPDSVLELEPVVRAHHLVVVLAMFSASDMLGGLTEYSRYSTGMTWLSFGMTLVVMIGPGLAVFIGGFDNLSVLWTIGIVTGFGALGSQLPRIGMDIRNRSAHRGAIFGGFVGIVIVVLISEPNRILLLGCLPIFTVSATWNFLDRYFGSKSTLS